MPRGSLVSPAGVARYLRWTRSVYHSLVCRLQDSSARRIASSRRAADAAQLSQFDFQTRYGRKALERLIESIRSRTLGVGRPEALFRKVMGDIVRRSTRMHAAVGKSGEQTLASRVRFRRPASASDVT